MRVKPLSTAVPEAAPKAPEPTADAIVLPLVAAAHRAVGLLKAHRSTASPEEAARATAWLRAIDRLLAG